MRFGIITIFIAAMLTILTASILITYNGITQTQTAFETGFIGSLETLAETSPELQKQIAVYKAFSKKQAVDITRQSMSVFWVVILVMSLLLISIILGITRPLKKLSAALSGMDFEQPSRDFTLFPEKGTMETRKLIRSFNLMMTRLIRYEAVAGDISRYRGWKEISRVIVHEINNLITPIRTYAEYLHERGADTEKTGFILAKLDELRTTLFKFRNLSHLPEPVFHGATLDSVVGELRLEFPKALFSLNTTGAVIVTDEQLLKEIARNLIKNSFESGASAVEVKLEMTPSGAEIAIIDDGPGIPEKNLERVFDPGFTTKKSGSGIGLALARGLSRQLKAALIAVPNRGKGAEFILKLPPGLKETQDENISS
ncbi:MAG: hypothetical protein A2Y33_03110 [Spirochaetes bacterium GWF1_51_8]|nr:MAG: hypothetical protein A2Y33_03110 [Spirochaetes bacterium GWF1_51_8]